jgi:tripartite ATP-independent transporter DctM subunit
MIPTALATFGLLAVCLLLDLPVAFAMLIAGVFGIWLTVGFDPIASVLAFAPYQAAASYTLSTLPMFVLMAEVLSAGRFTTDLFRLTHAFTGHVRGGISYAAIGGGVLLAAISGSSTAAASALASVAYPEMRRYDYHPRFASALVAVVGTLAIMIPPSLGLILYGVFTGTSVGRLLIAGLIPGVLTAAGYIVTILVVLRRNPHFAPRAADPVAWQARRQAIGGAWPVLLLLALMLWALYSGAITPTEVGAVGALAAMAIGILAGRLGPRALWDAATRAALNSAMILTIVAFSSILGVFMALNGTIQTLLDLVAESGLPAWAILICVLAVVLTLGFFLDQLAIIVLTLPIIFPLLTSLGYDPVWLGVVMVKTAEIGLVTPPMGLNVLVVSGVARLPASEVFRGIWPFVVTELVLLALLILFPPLSIWLPSLVYG